ncbi:UvrB/UvrC motif-containing protein [soil metagenome]
MPRAAQDGLDLFAAPLFEGFGPSRFHVDQLPPGGHRIQGKRTLHIKKGVTLDAPRRPGVYAMLDPRGRLIYVGKAKCLRTRLMSYFRTKSRDRKAGKIIGKTRTLLWEFAATELAALLRELELIQRHRPRYNVIGLPGRRRYCYLALGRPAAAYAYVTQEPTGKETALYGPFIGRSYVEEGVRRLNDHFKLRDCAATFPMAFADQGQLFDSDKSAGCLRYELGTCLGPCGGGCTRQRYSTAVRQVKAFLEGRDRSIITTLTKQMIDAAKSQQYEKAGTQRDKLKDVEWLDLRLKMLRNASHASAFVYPLLGHEGKTVWYLLNRGRIWGSTAAPVTVEEHVRVADVLKLMLSDAGDRHDLVKHVDSVLLVAAWFRKNAVEKAKLRAAEEVLAELRMAASRTAA